MTGVGRIDGDRLDATRVARQLQARTNGRWLCWFGFSTGRYWAIRTVPGLYQLAEGRTPKDLLAAMAEIDAFYGS